MAVIIGSLVFGFIVMALWNAVVPDIFKGPYLTYWQAVGLLLLMHILFRGWTPWPFHRAWYRGHYDYRSGMEWASMSAEEREKFRKKMREEMRRHWRRTPWWETTESEKDEKSESSGKE